jgi:hypothetical protein
MKIEAVYISEALVPTWIPELDPEEGKSIFPQNSGIILTAGV